MTQTCFVELDLRQAEWIVTAHLASDPSMLQAIRDGVDVHVRTGHLISGVDEEWIKAEAKLVGQITDPTMISLMRNNLPPPPKGTFLPRSMSIRQCGKKSNHGLNYGMQYRKFALINEVEEAEGARIVMAYHRAYPGLKQYYTRTEYELRTFGRRLTNCFGQSRRFLEEWNGDLLTAAYAFKPQSTVANVTCRGWQQIFSHEALRRVHPSAQVHDSVLTTNEYDTPQELLAQIQICANLLRIPIHYDEQFTLDVDVKVGTNWGGDCMIPLDYLSPSAEAALAAALEKSSAEATRRSPQSI